MTRAALAALALFAQAATAETIVVANYTDPTDRYTHGILGDAIEWGTLEIVTDGAPGAAPKTYQFSLPQTRVFEDVAPRLADIDGDGTPEVIVVETHIRLGAQLAIYDETGKIAATPHIGRTNRWLAPIGAADLDNDGFVEIAYIDRPHLAKTLRIWRFKEGELTEIAAASGLTNHRIGEPDIAGGIRDCGDGPELITADASWTQIIASRLAQDQITARSLGPHKDRSSFTQALRC